MTKAETYRRLSLVGDEVRFIANLIHNRHTKPAKKLRGLYRLVTANKVVCLASFSIDRLYVDGSRFAWKDLETV